MGEKRVDRFIFKLSDLLGEGSYGKVSIIIIKVYKGYEDKVHTQVAIKTLSKSVINADEYLRDGLMSEIRVMQQLKSENVVQLIDVLETQNNYYIVQEYCDGGDFQHYLKKKGKLNQNEAVKFFVDILMGFMCLVKKGIIHRDVKPANILINKGVYKLAGMKIIILDFGFAKTMDNFRNQMMTSAVGTPLYMSPQILKNEKYTTKSDVWSMGFIFYETICGKPPWNARSIPELIKNIKTIPLTFPADLQIDIEYQNMIRGCLQMQESDRLNWDEIYSHKCFGRAFQFYIEGNKKMEDKALFLVNDLRLKVIHDNIDLELLFKQIDVSGDQQLDMHELGKLLHRIDKSLDREEIEYIFNKIDTDSSNSIDLSEFKKWLEDNNVRITSKYQRNDQYHLSQNQINIDQKPKIISEKVLPDNSPQYVPPTQMSQQSQSKQPQYVHQPSGSANMGLQDGSTSHPQQPYPPVGNPGIFPNGQQPYQAPFPQPYTYNQQQFQQPPVQPFGYQSNRGQVPNYPPYPQQPGFQAPAQQVPGYQAPYQQPYQQNAQQWGTQSQMDRCNETIRKLVLAIEKYNINIWELFKKYDTSGGQSLDEAEFGIMLRRIDQKLSDQDIRAAFQLFDTDSSGQLTFSEFKEGLEYQIKQQQLRNSQQQQFPPYQQQHSLQYQQQQQPYPNYNQTYPYQQ